MLSKTVAISSNPSSRAVLAKLGYISVYSSFSPAAAAFKFSAVVPNNTGKFPSVYNVSPAKSLFINFINLLACSFS